MPIVTLLHDFAPVLVLMVLLLLVAPIVGLVVFAPIVGLAVFAPMVGLTVFAPIVGLGVFAPPCIGATTVTVVELPPTTL